MTLEDLQKEVAGEKPSLKILRGGKFDEVPLIRRIDKILQRVQNTDNVDFLFWVFNQYHTMPLDESLKEEERDKAEEISAMAAKRLSELGYSVSDRNDDKSSSITERYNV